MIRFLYDLDPVKIVLKPCKCDRFDPVTIGSKDRVFIVLRDRF